MPRFHIVDPAPQQCCHFTQWSNNEYCACFACCGTIPHSCDSSDSCRPSTCVTDCGVICFSCASQSHGLQYMPTDSECQTAALLEQQTSQSLLTAVHLCYMQLKTFRTNPLMDQGPMRVKTGKAFLMGFEDIKKGESTLTLPILLVSSPTDTVSIYLPIDIFLTECT